MRSAEAADSSEDVVDYAQAGRDLLDEVKGGTAPGRFDPANHIWQHPRTAALLYVGSASAAGSREILGSLCVCKIVFCQENGEGACHFEGQPGFEYLRYPIGAHRQSRLASRDPLAYFAILFDFVEGHLGRGENVLIHCLAGAHRAGTAGVACLMEFNGMSAAEATKKAKERRPAINPIGGFPQLLANLEQAQNQRRIRQRKKTIESGPHVQKTAQRLETAARSAPHEA